MVMVLDSSGSMKERDGSGGTRMDSARKAVGSVVDSLPDAYPTGLRVYGADKPKGCTDTRLAKPVQPLDRDGIKQAVAGVKPKGDTPIGYSLQQAAKDLPEPKAGALGHRSIVLISDGESNCAPDPCKVAAQLGKKGIDLRIDTIGFQVRGKAKRQLECIAEQGHGSYYDAPDAAALARQLERAGRLSADGYRFKGKQITGSLRPKGATGIQPGQYLDSIGPGEKKYYTAELDAKTAADFAVTAVPQPGVKTGMSDGLDVELTTADDYAFPCDAPNGNVGFPGMEGATPITAAASRIPTEDGDGSCDKAGTYLLKVERETEAESSQSRWPIELVYSTEGPLKKGITPAQSETEYGAWGPEGARLPTGQPKTVAGGTGFNDATAIESGVWKDKVLPGQTRYYKVPVGWGQQLRYKAEFANEPTVDERPVASSFVHTDAYSPRRVPVKDSEFDDHSDYSAEPAAVDFGTVPVSWTNRWEDSDGAVQPVRMKGDYYLAVTLGPKAAEFAKNTAIGVVLRVETAGKAKAGPQHNAPALKAQDDNDAGTRADSEGSDGTGLSLPLLAGIAGGALLVAAAVAFIVVRTRRGASGSGNGTVPTRGEW
ncbi:VWA domain-containing protein [Streptomyces sp. A7024]|uniref:VWA domain-containing protein n=2 Tax=Streptomyces coryli TaxID=1128680 RepID=A0A6G4TVW2_9ACTN|nr:VWA domain-containing protein [Streptomyces coryli]